MRSSARQARYRSTNSQQRTNNSDHARALGTFERFPRSRNTKENPMTTASAATKPAQIRVTKRSSAYWCVTIDNPPLNVMGPEMVKQFQEVINALEADEQVRVVVFDSAVDDYFLNHSDFTAKLEDLASLPERTTGLPPWAGV